MSRTLRLINGKGDWEDTPPTGATDSDLYHLGNDFIVQGGVVDLEAGDALVTESDTPGFSVKVQKGIIYVENSAWLHASNVPRFYQVVGDSDDTVAVPTNSSGSTRVDLICQKIDKITPPNDDADNVAPLVRVAGTPGAGAPAVPDDHLLLATLTLPDGYSAVTNDMIEDNRQQVYLETKDINGGFTEVADTANITINLGTTKIRKFLVGPLTANRNFNLTNPKKGDVVYVVFENDSTARSPQWQFDAEWYGIENDPAMADYVDASKKGSFLFVWDEINEVFQSYFLGAVE